jgi:hypothetical protein
VRNVTLSAACAALVNDRAKPSAAQAVRMCGMGCGPMADVKSRQSLMHDAGQTLLDSTVGELNGN